MKNKRIKIIIQDIKDYGWKWNLEFFWLRFLDWSWGYYHKYWLHKGKLNPFISCGHIDPYHTLWNDLQDLRGTDFTK